MALTVANGTTAFKCFPIRPAHQYNNSGGGPAVISMAGGTHAAAIKQGDAIILTSGFALVDNSPATGQTAQPVMVGFAAEPKAAFTQDTDQLIKIFPGFQNTIFEGTLVGDATTSHAVSATYATAIGEVVVPTHGLIEAEATATGGSFCVIDQALAANAQVHGIGMAWRQPDGSQGIAAALGKSQARILFFCMNSIFNSDRLS